MPLSVDDETFYQEARRVAEGSSRVQVWVGVSAFVVAGFVLAAAPADAGVRVEKLPDGRVVIVNDGVGGGHGHRAPTPARLPVAPVPATAAAAAGDIRPAVLVTSVPDAAAPASPGAPALDLTTLAALIDRHSDDHGLDPRLVRAVVAVESDFNHHARSPKGAMGLMQLMPATAAVLAVADPYDPDQNLRGGTAYLSRLLARYDGNVELALAAYNAGPEAVDRYDGIPPYAETRQYVRRVLALYQGREVAVGELASLGRGPSPRLERGDDGHLRLTNTAY